MPTRDEVYAQIRALPHKYVFYTKREINYLPQILSEDEQIMALTSGYHGKTTMLLCCTNRRLLFVDKGMFFGVKVKQLNLDRIQSIDSSYVLVFGSIRIWDGAAAYEISMILKDSIDPFVKAVRTAIDQYRGLVYRDIAEQNMRPALEAAVAAGVAPAVQTARHMPPPQPRKSPPMTNQTAPDMLGQLERLAKLKEQGYLTPEEFEEQKSKLLKA